MSFRNVLIALDQLANTLIGGKPDETISARAWRCQADSRGWELARVVIDLLFFFDPEHCKTSYQSELERRQLPGEYRTAFSK